MCTSKKTEPQNLSPLDGDWMPSVITLHEPKKPKMSKGGQIWLKCITGDLIMMIRDKNNIFERVENFHADLAWNYPSVDDLNKADQFGEVRRYSGIE